MHRRCIVKPSIVGFDGQGRVHILDLGLARRLMKSLVSMRGGRLTLILMLMFRLQMCSAFPSFCGRTLLPSRRLPMDLTTYIEHFSNPEAGALLGSRLLSHRLESQPYCSALEKSKRSLVSRGSRRATSQRAL